MNATPAAYDMLVGGVWKTILFGGENDRTNGMFALDVTDPTNGNQRSCGTSRCRGSEAR